MINDNLGITNPKIGKIGFFDSGFGGLQTMRLFHDLYPAYDYIFLADTKNCPYGEKDPEEIKEMTFTGLHRLFDHGATIVILACNTASAYAIRPRQQEHPDKKVLSITIPGIEALFDRNIHGYIGILATQATIKSHIYDSLIQAGNHQDTMTIESVAAPKLVELVEQGCEEHHIIQQTIQEYIDRFKHPLDCLILGCTHFPILIDDFEHIFNNQIIHPSAESAEKFSSYLFRHPEIEQKLSQNSSLIYYTTGPIENFDRIGSKIMGLPIDAKHEYIEI